MSERENELAGTLNHYFNSSDRVSIHFCGTGTTVRQFCDMLQTGELLYGDAPDMLIKKSKKSLIVEHFEFDSYKVTRKGSKNRQEQSRIDRAVENKEFSAKLCSYKDEIHGESSYKNYIVNVKRNFIEHYSQIDTYKRNLIEKKLIDETTIVEVLFIIDDVSPLGTMVVGESSATIPVCLAQCKEFLETLNNSPNVNYVLACSSAGNTNCIWFIDCQEIKEYEKEAIDFSSMQFIEFKPKVSSFKATFPRKI